MKTPPPRTDLSHVAAQALQWLSTAMTVVVMMALPGFGGRWLDKRFHTKYLTLLGFLLGLALGIYYLLAAVANQPKKRLDGSKQDESDQS